MDERSRKFETERTRRFRASELTDSDEETITHIETFGRSVIHVKSSTTGPGWWSYTVGVYDTCGKPEIIEVGLRQRTAHKLLNEAASWLRGILTWPKLTRNGRNT